MIRILSLRTIAALILLFVLTGNSFAQSVTETAASEPPVEMATGLYQSGKIYVVVIVLTVIMLGIFAYLIMLDRKVSKLEKEVEKKA
jgi:CcmD family protein